MKLLCCQKYKISGTTIYKGIMSFGANSLLNSPTDFTISKEKSVIIELIDKEERLSDFSEIASRLLKKSGSGGIIYLEDVQIIFYNHSATDPDK